MYTVLLGILAALVGISGILSKHEALDRPADQFELPQTLVGAGPGSMQVRIEPFSELKYRSITRQAYDYSCGSAALVTILHYHLGLNVTEQQSMEGMMDKGEKEKIIERRGFSLLDMKRYVASIGLNSAGFRGEIADLRTLDQPAIVPIDYAGFKHFVVLRGVRDGLVFLADPSAGNIIFSIKEFSTLWDRNTLFIIYPKKGVPIAGKLALLDSELGVTDMDRIKDHALLRPIDMSHQMERLLNGQGGVSIHQQ